MTANVVLNEMYLWKAVLFSEADPQRCPLRFLVQEICIPLHPGIKKIAISITPFMLNILNNNIVFIFLFSSLTMTK